MFFSTISAEGFAETEEKVATKATSEVGVDEAAVEAISEVGAVEAARQATVGENGQY